MIERTLPLRMHKNLVIQFLRSHPEDREMVIAGWRGTIQEYIEALESSPGQYFVGGVLEEGPSAICHCGYKAGHAGLCQGLF